MTVSEAASQRGVSAAMVYSAITRGLLPRRYDRGHLVVRETDLMEWGRTRRVGGRAGSPSVLTTAEPLAKRSGGGGLVEKKPAPRS